MRTSAIAFTAVSCAATIILFSATGAVRAADPDAGPAASGFAALEQQFRELPPEARLHTGPLFWLHGDDSKERLEMYVGKVAEGGNGAFTTESPPHPAWRGEGWGRALVVCLNAEKKQTLKMWFFEEKWGRSQS